MRNMAIIAAVSGAFLFSGLAQADNRSAQLHVMETVPEECNIGLAFGGNGQAGVGVSGLAGSFDSLGEINLLGSNQLLITGAVKCNAANGYKVTLMLDNGEFVNGANPSAVPVEYKLEGVPAGTTMTTLLYPTTAAAPGAVGPHDVASTSQLSQEAFQLKMTGFDFTGLAAGAYKEDMTFSIVTL